MIDWSGILKILARRRLSKIMTKIKMTLDIVLQLFSSYFYYRLGDIKMIFDYSAVEGFGLVR